MPNALQMSLATHVSSKKVACDSYTELHEHHANATFGYACFRMKYVRYRVSCPAKVACDSYNYIASYSATWVNTRSHSSTFAS